MRFLSFRRAGTSSYGAIVGDGIVDLGVRLGARAPTLKTLLERDEFSTAADLASAGTADVALADVEYLPTIPDPGKIVCIGINYGNRNAE